MLEAIKKEWIAKVVIVWFLIITGWWVSLFLSDVQQTPQNYLFGATYGLINLWAAFCGLMIARKWGGWSSVIGRAISVLSLGLLAQEFGQLIFSYHNVFLGVEVPYPSLADIGFFGTIPFYIYGIYCLAKAAGVKFSLNTFINQFQALIIPVIILSASYFIFLREYTIDWSDQIKTFLDFGYPLGEAVYISIAILTFSLSRKLLGGVMRNKILFVVLAFILQYVAEFNFLFQNNNGTWVNGGYGDYLYFLAYTAMALGLIQFKTVLSKIEKEK